MRSILTRPRDPAKLAADVLDMRERIRQQHPGDHFWDIKYRRGGMLDVEFIAQFLQLRHAASMPSVLRPNTGEALQALAADGCIADDVAADLLASGRLWHRLLGMLRLTVGPEIDEKMVGDGLGRSLAAGAGLPDIDALRREIEQAALRVAALFDRLIVP